MAENKIEPEVQRLKEIAKRAALATTAPWKVDVSENFGNDWPITTGTSSKDGKVYHVCTDDVRASEVSGDAKTDAEFIAHARQDIPWLLDLIAKMAARGTLSRDSGSLTCLHKGN